MILTFFRVNDLFISYENRFCCSPLRNTHIFGRPWVGRFSLNFQPDSRPASCRPAGRLASQPGRTPPSRHPSKNVTVSFMKLSQIHRFLVRSSLAAFSPAPACQPTSQPASQPASPSAVQPSSPITRQPALEFERNFNWKRKQTA